MFGESFHSNSASLASQGIEIGCDMRGEEGERERARGRGRERGGGRDFITPTLRNLGRERPVKVSDVGHYG